MQKHVRGVVKEMKRWGWVEGCGIPRGEKVDRVGV
jgi:hypothetical protein